MNGSPCEHPGKGGERDPGVLGPGPQTKRTAALQGGVGGVWGGGGWVRWAAAPSLSRGRAALCDCEKDVLGAAPLSPHPWLLCRTGPESRAGDSLGSGRLKMHQVQWKSLNAKYG